jgi:pimeloyl-ACP methyl ester carboxylesterase
MFEFLAAQADANDNVRLHRSYEALLLELRADAITQWVRVDADGAAMLAAPPAEHACTSLRHVGLNASLESWEKQQQVSAPCEYQALSTMRRKGHLEVTGDLLAFSQHLLLLEMLFTPAGRKLATQGGEQPPDAEVYFEAVTGRYVNLPINGQSHRVYFEEAGSGIPLLCLHTAGADGRQFRALLNDARVTRNFRVIAFDLPWHGKSSPPVGFDAQTYRLTTDLYVDTVMAFTQALQLHRPVVMGCSIGGRAVLHLALRHAAQFRAAIGLQSALYANDSTGNVEDATHRLLHRPDVHGGKIAGALMNGVMAPQSPHAERWETMWHYMQGGPGIFMGDLHYYFTDGDLRNGAMLGYDANKCPLFLLSGEYDPSATPEMGAEVAAAVGARHFEIMREMGHFPMSENPGKFMQYLLPVLAQVQSLEE